MNSEQIYEILNYISDSDYDEGDYSSSEEYRPPGNEQVYSEHSDSICVENDIDLDNSEWNFDVNMKPEFVEFIWIPSLQYEISNFEPLIYFNLFFVDDLFLKYYYVDKSKSKQYDQ